MIESGSSLKMRSTSRLATGSPGTIAPKSIAASRSSKRRSASRWLASGPWHAKQYSDSTGRMSRLNSKSWPWAFRSKPNPTTATVTANADARAQAAFDTSLTLHLKRESRGHLGNALSLGNTLCFTIVRCPIRMTVRAMPAVE